MGIGRFYSRIVGGSASAGDVRRAAVEAYRRSYDRACRSEARRGWEPPSGLPQGVGTREHAFALFCVLAGRRGDEGGLQRLTRPMTLWRWVELAPFLYLRQDHAVEALGEYLLWKEETGRSGGTDLRARTRWLGDRVREGVRRAEEVDPEGLISLAQETDRERRHGASPWIRWTELL